MNRKLLSTLMVGSLAVIALIVIAAIVLTSRSTQTEADTLIAGVPIDELAEMGFILKEAPADSSISFDREAAIALSTREHENARLLDSALVSFRTDQGVLAKERLAWAVALDPLTVDAEPRFGPLPNNLENPDLETAGEVKYQIGFWDAQTGELLVSVSVASLPE
ncbi:MAG: hypothetical protein J4O14_02015 [Chloroflexi bacterium]|nr:hypothetical protein [Chloroflexota bacterium]MCH7953883.1 hypothetical protein [Chloroflexota bacterium]MCI0783408.1 hypothetical protein [Chloroflexota bacterium]MCI0814401.1 hypothetical protein [Chloroflexota bacterium]MCI0817028.1 hypothetical protein [Chloroflexota bacterium]